MSGQFMVDSFDSSDPNYSTGGQYDPSKRKDNGDIGSNSNNSDAIDLSGQIEIYGRAAVGPGGGVKFSGSQEVIGSTSFIGAGGSGVESGRLRKDMNVSFPSVSVPFTGGYLTPSSGNVSGTNYAKVLNGGDFRLSTISMSGQEK